MTQSSFYVDGETYSTATVTSNDTPGSATPSQAPSSFFQSGGIYNALAEESSTVTLFQQLLASTQAAQAAAAASASAAAASAASVPSASVTNPLQAGTAAPGTAATYSRGDHVHPTDTSRAPVASPAFSGTPTAPTATAGTNTTQLATTAFVLANGTSLGSTTPVMDGTGAAGTATVAARADHVHPSDTTKAGLSSNNSFSGTQAITNSTASTTSTTGALTVSGGVGIAGDVFTGGNINPAGAVRPKMNPTTDWGLDFSNSAGLVVPASSSVALPVGSGLVILVDSTFSGQSGMYMIGGSTTSAAAFLAGGSHYSAPTVTPASGQYSIGFDGTHWKVYNGHTTLAITFLTGLIKVRNTV